MEQHLTFFLPILSPFISVVGMAVEYEIGKMHTGKTRTLPVLENYLYIVINFEDKGKMPGF